MFFFLKISWICQRMGEIQILQWYCSIQLTKGYEESLHVCVCSGSQPFTGHTDHIQTAGQLVEEPRVTCQQIKFTSFSSFFFDNVIII